MEITEINSDAEIKIYPSRLDKIISYLVSFFILLMLFWFCISIINNEQGKNNFSGLFLGVIWIVIAYFVSKKHLKREPEFILSKDTFRSKDTSYIKWEEIKYFYNKIDVDGDILYVYDFEFNIKKSFSSYGNKITEYSKIYFPEKVLNDNFSEQFEYWLKQYQRKTISIEELKAKDEEINH